MTGVAPLLRIEDLTVRFASAEGLVTVVDHVDLSIDRGATVGLVGESGSGKTVTGLSVLGLLGRSGARVTGRAMFDGIDLIAADRRTLRRIRGARISMIFQDPTSSLNPAFTVGDQIAEVVRHHRGLSRRASLRRAVEMLDLVGIADAGRRCRSYPHEFSGGMRQRVMIAMALCCDPSLLIADEPTTALDVTVQAQVLELLRDMRDRFDMSLLMITHDLGVVADICDDVVVMYAGHVVERSPAESLFERPGHPYSEGLLMSMPEIVARTGRIRSIPGAPPAPLDRPIGCRFEPRCRYAVDLCSDRSPKLEPMSEDRSSRCHRAADLTLDGAT